MATSIGPIIFDLKGFELEPEEREILQHPLIGGVIFFARNYESPEQITQLAHSIRAARKAPILLTVDQEGGRVQRFRLGFTRLPHNSQLGQLYENSPAIALDMAKTCGWLMAAEVLAVGVDLSFAPVLDIDKSINPAISSRGFHSNPDIIVKLAEAYTQGMREAGMAAVGKHFPGHGSVKVDSHLDLPVDNRELPIIQAEDMVPFANMIRGGIEGIMTAHIEFPQVDALPVSFSHYWLHDILRQQLKFSGMVFTDDLSMEGANVVGGFPERAKLALDAGCDMILICNHRENLLKTLDGLATDYKPVDAHKFKRVQGNFTRIPKLLKDSHEWQERYNAFAELMEHHQLLV